MGSTCGLIWELVPTSAFVAPGMEAGRRRVPWLLELTLRVTLKIRDVYSASCVSSSLALLSLYNYAVLLSNTPGAFET